MTQVPLLIKIRDRKVTRLSNEKHEQDISTVIETTKFFGKFLFVTIIQYANHKRKTSNRKPRLIHG